MCQAAGAKDFAPGFTALRIVVAQNLGSSMGFDLNEFSPKWGTDDARICRLLGPGCVLLECIRKFFSESVSTRQLWLCSQPIVMTLS